MKGKKMPITDFDQLLEWLKEPQIVFIEYEKLNGDISILEATLNGDIINQYPKYEKKTTRTNKKAADNDNIIVFCVQRKAWRSLQREGIKGYRRVGPMRLIRDLYKEASDKAKQNG